MSQKKFPPLNSLQLSQILTDFQIICTAGKPVKFATKPILQYHLTLGMLLHYLGKLETFAYIQQMWKKMGTTCIFIASDLFFIHKCGHFQCLNSELFSILVANKIFHVTVLLLVYFCNQFVAPVIRHSSVCQQSTRNTAMRTKC